MLPEVLTLLLPGAIIINLWTFLCFWKDKIAAISGARRISEADLLTLAIFGGAPAAVVARRVLRHKTRKQPFSDQLTTIFVVQIAIIGSLCLSALM